MSSESSSAQDAAPSPEAAEPAAPAAGIKKRNLVIIGLVVAGIWAAAIASGSIAGLIIAGVLTLVVAVLGFWVWRQLKRHRQLTDILQNAGASPEARREALAALSADKKSDEGAHVLARAQLLAADDPAAALALLEPVQLKGFPAAMQGDLCLLKSQLLLTFGRPKDALPLAEWMNLDDPARAQLRPLMVAILAETWARTGSADKADELLASEDLGEAAGDAQIQLLFARAFAHFAKGKKGKTRATMRELAAKDPNYLGRFLAPQSRVHPGLQRLAREVAQRSGAVRNARPHVAAGRRGRRR